MATPTGYEGKVAVVTGAASGIGRALAEALHRRGARLVLGDLDEAGLGRLTGALGCAGLPTDVRNRDQVAALVALAVQRHGRIDLLFNNAGVAVGGEVLHQRPEDWDQVLDVNLGGVVHGVQAAYPRMAAQGSGHIVNVASLAGLVPTPGLVPYATSKHAVVGLSESLRPEAATHGVRVSVVCPGFVDTRILHSRFVGPEVDRERVLRGVWPWPFLAPEALAETVLREVARNRPYIVVPRVSRMLWRVYRMSPGGVLRRFQRLAARRRRPMPGGQARPDPGA